jgi:glycosyltransferase involved in cell wall biosynthesis
VKIACLSNASAVHTAPWVDYFRGRGHEVRLYSLEPDLANRGVVALPRLPLPGLLRYPLAAPALRRALAEFAPDLVDAHFVPNYGLLGALSGWRPLCVTAWGSDLLLGMSSALRRARARWVLARADRVLVDAENLARAARDLGAPAEKVLVIAWGVEMSRFDRAAPREPGLMVTTRMHEPVYDVPVVLHAAAMAMRERQDLRLVVAGDGSLRPQLELQARALLPAGRFEFVGRVDAPTMAVLLGRAEIYLSASRSDSTSVSLLEAMAAGAVPVLSDLEANREWVADGDGARLFRVGDPSAAADALRAALQDPGWRERARRRNRTAVEVRASRERNMAAIESEFRRLAGKRA